LTSLLVEYLETVAVASAILSESLLGVFIGTQNEKPGANVGTTIDRLGASCMLFDTSNIGFLQFFCTETEKK